MNAPRRLLEEGGTSLELALLRSAKDDDPPPDALVRAMAAVGLSGGVMGAGAGASSSGAMPKPSNLMRWLFELVTWAVVGGVLGGALFIGGPARLGNAQSTVGPTATHTAAGAAAAQVDEEAAADGDEGRDASSDSEARGCDLERGRGAGNAAEAQREQGAQPPRARKIAAPSRPTLAEEVALLDSARRALSAGDSAGAMNALARHAVRFPYGALAAEAAVLRIEAMAARGENREAAAAAREFLAASPQDPHAGHVRDILRAQSREPAAPSEPSGR